MNMHLMRVNSQSPSPSPSRCCYPYHCQAGTNQNHRYRELGCDKNREIVENKAAENEENEALVLHQRLANNTSQEILEFAIPVMASRSGGFQNYCFEVAPKILDQQSIWVLQLANVAPALVFRALYGGSVWLLGSAVFLWVCNWGTDMVGFDERQGSININICMRLYRLYKDMFTYWKLRSISSRHSYLL